MEVTSPCEDRCRFFSRCEGDVETLHVSSLEWWDMVVRKLEHAEHDLKQRRSTKHKFTQFPIICVGLYKDLGMIDIFLGY